MTVKDKVKVSNRTKIVATIGPSSSTEAMLRELIRGGMDVARINFSHGGADANLALLANLRRAAKAEKKMVGVMQDLQGPKLRVGEIAGGETDLLESSIRTMQTGVELGEGDIIPLPNKQLHKELRRGDQILLNDGIIELEVLGVQGSKISVRVLLGGILLSRQGIAVPTRGLAVESLTDKDKHDLAIGLKAGVDWVALSFVRTAADVRELKEKIKEILPDDTDAPGVIVKVEKQEAVENIDEILKETDAVMVARGDLGLETSVSSVPVTQKMLIAKSLVAGKPVITATQMLSSMTLRPRPTRAEASDVANAVIDHTDCVMLSEETASGRFPARSVETMADIVARTEETPLDNLISDHESHGLSVPQALSGSAVAVARQVEASAILVTTISGYTARAVARFRPETPIFAVTPNARVARQLLLTWGVVPILADGDGDPGPMVQRGSDVMVDRYGITTGSRVVVVSGLRRKEGGFDSSVRVIEV